MVKERRGGKRDIDRDDLFTNLLNAAEDETEDKLVFDEQDLFGAHACQYPTQINKKIYRECFCILDCRARNNSTRIGVRPPFPRHLSPGAEEYVPADYLPGKR